MAKEEKSTIPPPLPPVVRKTMKSGLINKGAVSENERPQSSVLESINMHFDAIGSAILRKGTTTMASTGNSILGMHYLVDTVNSGANTQLIVVSGTSAYYYVAGSFTSKRTGLTAGSRARFTTYLNMAFMVNGTEATMTWNGDIATQFVATGNAVGAPTGRFIENFRSRVWITGNTTYPDRLYYSSVPSAAATPVVSWSTDPVTGTQWIDISPSDGDKNTGLQRYRNVMIVFKTNRLYRVFDIGQVDPDPYYAVGTSSQESVVETKTGVFFHHSSGIYQYNVYGQVQEVSRPIWDIIRAIPASYYGSVTGWLEADQDHVCWAVGTVTIDGITYTNLTVRYTISTQTWTHYTDPKAFTSAVKRQPFFSDGTTQFAVCGDESGNVVKMNVGKTFFDGTGIPYTIVHNWDTIDGLLSTRKSLTVGNFTHYQGGGTNVNYQTEVNDPDQLNDWSKRVGQLKGSANTGFNDMAIKARKLRFRISGVSTGEPFVYNGYELLDVRNEFIQFK